MIAIGIAGWWYNWHLATTSGEFYVKLIIIGPLGLFGGLLMFLRPEWAGPLRPDSTQAHKFALFALIGLICIVSGIDFYRLDHVPSPRRLSVTPWSAERGTPTLPAAREIPSFSRPSIDAKPAVAGGPSIDFLARTYRLGSYNQKHNPMWEFVSADENVDNWTTLLTIIDRPDARTQKNLDQLAEGVLANYKSRGAQILAARTMRGDSGAAFNYLVAAFDEPEHQRCELNFAKIALEDQNATIAIYGIRISDPQDYRAKAKEFLDQNSTEVGSALVKLVLPKIDELPRRVF
jgi:hypothetical protein